MSQIVILDVGWCGGIREARRIAVAVESCHLLLTPHDCTGPVVFAASTHLSVNTPNCLVQESVRVFYTGWYRELVTGLPVVEGGYVSPPEGPRLGTELLPGPRERADASVQSSTLNG